jgi:hypothetical protein
MRAIANERLWPLTRAFCTVTTGGEPHFYACKALYIGSIPIAASRK